MAKTLNSAIVDCRFSVLKLPIFGNQPVRSQGTARFLGAGLILGGSEKQKVLVMDCIFAGASLEFSEGSAGKFGMSPMMWHNAARGWY